MNIQLSFHGQHLHTSPYFLGPNSFEALETHHFCCRVFRGPLGQMGTTFFRRRPRRCLGPAVCGCGAGALALGPAANGEGDEPMGLGQPEFSSIFPI